MQEILTQKQVLRTDNYAEALIHGRWGNSLNWILDDLKQDFTESVIRSVVKGIEFDKALHYATCDLIDILREKRYYFSCRNRKTKRLSYKHQRFSQMDPKTWTEFHGIHSYSPEPCFVDSILTQQLLAMMGEKERAAWELTFAGWTQAEIADRTDKVVRNMISKRLSKGVAQAKKELEKRQ